MTWAGLAPGDNESPASASAPPLARGTGTCAPRWSSPPGPQPDPQPARRPVPAAGPPVGRGNEKKAAVAVARTLAGVAWTVMKNDQDYAEAGEDCYERLAQRSRGRIVQHHQQALARLGCQITLVPPEHDSPPPGTASPHTGQAA